LTYLSIFLADCYNDSEIVEAERLSYDYLCSKRGTNE
jgi:hypothetical protein